MHVQSASIPKPDEEEGLKDEEEPEHKPEKDDNDDEDGDHDEQQQPGVKLNRMRAVNKNILASSRICASPLSRRLFVLLCEFPVPVLRWFDTVLRAVKSPDETCSFMCGLAEG
eukprot:5022824-Amphidinium_carterae.1